MYKELWTMYKDIYCTRDCGLCMRTYDVQGIVDYV